MVSDDTILKVDATVIAGVLILLTITALPTDRLTDTQHTTARAPSIHIFHLFIAGIIIPFASSACFILIQTRWKEKKIVSKWGVYGAVMGFVYLILFIFIIYYFIYIL
jgi:hypothetical protein